MTKLVKNAAAAAVATLLSVPASAATVGALSFGLEGTFYATEVPFLEEDEGIEMPSPMSPLPMTAVQVIDQIPTGPIELGGISAMFELVNNLPDPTLSADYELIIGLTFGTEYFEETLSLGTTTLNDLTAIPEVGALMQAMGQLPQNPVGLFSFDGLLIEYDLTLDPPAGPGFSGTIDLIVSQEPVIPFMVLAAAPQAAASLTAQAPTLSDRLSGFDFSAPFALDIELQANVAAVPLPAGLPLMLGGIGLLAAMRRRS